MINFKREYIGLEKDRFLYPVSFTDKAKCNVYGRKKFITEAGEEQLSAHVFLISKDFWTFNAGQLDFTNYPNGIWNDYISIDIVERDEYTAPSINFGSMGDITPENLQGLSDYISKHLSDLEKRIVEDYLFIDEGVSENIELPNLPENHFWARRNGVIVGVNLDYLKADYEHLKNELWKNYESFNEKLQAALKKYYDDLELQMNNFFKDLIEKIREEAEKQLGLIAGAGGGLLHKIDQANHGFIFDPIVYENGVWKKATTTSGVDGIGVVISANTFFFLEAGEIEIPKGATDKDGQPLLDDEYYYMNEDGGTGFQKEEPVWFYQPLFHTRTYKGKLLANVSIDTMEDLRGQVVDTESGRTHGIALWGDIVPKFDTIEKLQKAFWLKEGEVVEVLGYYSAGDGAGHKRIIANEDDGSGIQLSNGLWGNIVHSGEINVNWFGTKGDGINDDTLAIKKLFSSNLASSVFFPKGEYLISSTIKISKFLETYNLKTIKGDRAKIKVNPTFDGEYCFVFDDSETKDPQMLNITGLTFDGDKAKKGIFFNNLQLFYIENCTFNNFMVGIEILKGYYGTLGKNLNIIDCTCGIYLTGTSNNSLLIQNVRLTSGISGILIGSHLGGVSIQNCIIESYDYGIAGSIREEKGGLNSFINITSNYFENNKKDIYLSRISVSEDFLTINTNVSTGGYLVPNCTIKNNYFIAVKTNGNCISISPCLRAVINSNHGVKRCELIQLVDRMPFLEHNIYCDDEEIEIVPVGPNSSVTNIRIFYPNEIVYSGRLHFNKLVRSSKNHSSDYFMDRVIAPTGKIIKITNKEFLEPLYGSFNPNELSTSFRKKCKVYIKGTSYDVTRKLDGNYLYKDKTELVAGSIAEFLKIGITGSDLLFYDFYSRMFVSYKDGTYKGTIYAYEDSQDKAFGTELPLSPKINQIFYHTEEKKYKIYNGNNWIDI